MQAAAYEQLEFASVINGGNTGCGDASFIIFPAPGLQL
jgi:hypothetical protein